MSFGALFKAIARRIRRRDVLEAALVAVAFLLYFAVRGAVIDRPAEAFQHSLDVISVQRKLGFFWEADMQNWILDNLFIVQSANIVYFWLHFPLIIVFGIFLYIKDRPRYTFLRDAFLASGALSLIIYGLYPVAPPRVLPDLAQQLGVSLPSDVANLVDTMSTYLHYAYQSQETGAFVNPYAAMPSLHFGWDFLLGMGIIWVFRKPWAVVLGIALPVMQIFAITVTANHYFLDAFAGAVVSIMGLMLAAALQKWAYPRLSAFVLLKFGRFLDAPPSQVGVGNSTQESL